MSFMVATGLIFILALILTAVVWIGERREGHARDDA